MPVDPVLKQNLLLVRDAFEAKVAQQSSYEAAILPVRAVVGQQAVAHAALAEAARRYPSHYAAETDPHRSSLERFQDECIPCAARIQALTEIDIGEELYSAIADYDGRILKHSLDLFKSIAGFQPSKFEVHLCSLYRALRAQCLPDLVRMNAILAYMEEDLRRIQMPKLKGGFLRVVIGIIGRFLAGLSTGLERFTILVADTMQCILHDITFQLAKVQPVTPDAVEERIDRAAEAVGGAALDVAASGRTADEFLVDQVKRATDKVYRDSFLAKLDLLKLLKSSEFTFAEIVALAQQIQDLVGLLRMLETLLTAVAGGGFDPCNTDAGRRLLTRIQIPDRKVLLDPGPEGSAPEDEEILIASDPISFDNPIVRDVLEGAGIEVLAASTTAGTSDDSSGTENPAAFTVHAEPLTINLLKCLGPATDPS